MFFLKQSTAATVKIGPFLDSTDGNTAETGLTISQADVRLSKNGGNMAQKNESSAATHDELGYYDCDLDTTDTGTLGRLKLMVHESGALAVWHEFMIVPANVYDSLVGGTDSLEVDATAISGDTTAADNAESFFDGTGYAGTNNVIPTVTTLTGHTAQTGDNYARLGAPAGASVSADIATIEAQTDDIGAAGAGLTAVPWNAAWDAEVQSEVTDALNAYDPPTKAELDSGFAGQNDLSAAEVNAEVDTALTDIHLDHLLAATYDPASKPGAADALLNEIIENDGGVSRFTANSLEQAPSGTGASAATIADAVWEEAIADHSGTGGSTAEALAGASAPTAAAVADAVWDEAIADHQGAGSTGELLQDIDDEVDEIHAQIDSIAVTGSSLNQIAESDTLTTGSETSGTYASTQASDDTRHVITAASNEIDIYYQFDIGASGVPVSVQIEGYLKEGVPAGGDTIDLYAYDWVGTTWELIHTAIFTGITTDGPDENNTHTLFSRHVGTGGNDGIVRVRFQAASLEAGTTLNLDQLYISYAESIAADITSILADSNELQTDWTDGGRLDLLVDSILADTGELQTDWTNGGRLDLIIDAVLADTGELQSDDVPGLIAALNDPTAAAIADQVWDESLAAHVGAGSTGKQLSDVALTDELPSSPPTVGQIADQVWEEAIADHSGTGGSVAEALDAIETDTAALNDTALPDSVPADGSIPTLKQAIYMINQFLMERSVASTTVTVKKVDGSTSLMTFTLDDDTSPTSISRAT